MTIDEFIDKYLDLDQTEKEYDYEETDPSAEFGSKGKLVPKADGFLVPKTKQLKIDYDSYGGCQCVDVYKQYTHDVCGVMQVGTVGNAKLLYNNFPNKKPEAGFNQDEVYDRITSPLALQKGDIAIRTNGTYGHVVLIIDREEDEKGILYLISLEQDGRAGNTNGFVHARKKEATYYTGGLRPKNAQQSADFDKIMSYKLFPVEFETVEAEGTTLDEIKGTGWFTEKALRSYIYTAAGISADDTNLIKMFDEQMQQCEGYGEVFNFKKTDKHCPDEIGAFNYLDNIENESVDDLVFNGEELKNLFKNKDEYAYVCAGDNNGVLQQGNGCIGAFFRYGSKLDNLKGGSGEKKVDKNILKKLSLWKKPPSFSTFNRVVDENNEHIVFVQPSLKKGKKFSEWTGFVKENDEIKEIEGAEHPYTDDGEQLTLNDVKELDKLSSDSPIDFKDYFRDDRIFYFTDSHSFNPYIPFSKTNRKGGCSEISTQIKFSEMNERGLKNFVLVGFRIYFANDFGDFSENNKNLAEAPSFKEFLTSEISLNHYKTGTLNTIKEIAFFFRNRGDRKLYKYIFNLLDYRSVVLNSQKDQNLYFIPMLCNFNKDSSLALVQGLEGWYGNYKVDSNGKLKYEADVSKSFRAKPLFAKSYIQFGSWNGDLYKINNRKDYWNNDVINDTIGENVSYSNPGGWKEVSNSMLNSLAFGRFNKTFLKTDFSKEEDDDFTAEDLKGCVVGCFSKQPPDKDKLPDGWAMSYGKTDVDVNLKPNEKFYKYIVDVISEDGQSHEFGQQEPKDFFKSKKLRLNEIKFANGENYKRSEEDKAYLDKIPAFYKTSNTEINVGDSIFEMEVEYLEGVEYKLKDGKIVIVNNVVATEQTLNTVPFECGKYNNDMFISLESSEGFINYIYTDGVVGQYGAITAGIGTTHSVLSTIPDSNGLKQKMKEFSRDLAAYIDRDTGGVLFLKKDSFGDGSSKYEDTPVYKRLEEVGKTDVLSCGEGWFGFRSYPILRQDAMEAVKCVMEKSKLPILEKNLKVWGSILDGRDEPFDEMVKKFSGDAKFGKHVIGGLPQSAYNILADFMYNGTDFTRFSNRLRDELLKKINKRTNLSDNEKIKIFNDCMADNRKYFANGGKYTSVYKDNSEKYVKQMTYTRREILAAALDKDLQITSTSNKKVDITGATAETTQKLKLVFKCVATKPAMLLSSAGGAIRKIFEKDFGLWELPSN